MADTQPKVLYIELTDRQPSSFVKEGSDDVRLDAPSRHRIMNESVVVVQGKDGGLEHRAIRYCAGANTIFKDEQEKAGIKPNPLTDNIWVENAYLTVVDKGADRMKFAYLKACEFNEHAPNRPDGAITVFREIRTEEVAKADITLLRLQRQAADAIADLYEEVGDDGYKYDEERIGYLATLFGVAAHETPAERLVAINSIAQSDPKRFLNTIADKVKDYRVAVREALSLAVINLDGPQASFTSDRRTFLKFKTTDREKRVEELVKYLVSPKGEMDYRTLAIGIEQAKTAQLELS